MCRSSSKALKATNTEHLTEHKKETVCLIKSVKHKHVKNHQVTSMKLKRKCTKACVDKGSVFVCVCSVKHVVVGLVVRLVEVLDLLLGAARPLSAGRRQRLVLLVGRPLLRFLSRKQETALLRCTRAHVHAGRHSLWWRVCSSSSWDCSPPQSPSPSSSSPGLYLSGKVWFSLCGSPEENIWVRAYLSEPPPPPASCPRPPSPSPRWIYLVSLLWGRAASWL